MEGPMDTVSRRLRSDTASIHARVERGMDLLGRMSSRSGYFETLIRIEAFYRVLEPALAQSATDQIGQEYFDSRLVRLRADLDAIDLAWRPARAPSIPDLLTRWPHALGGLYVVEGAALGGQIIARQICERLELSCRFFSGESGSVGKRWKDFREILDRHPDGYAEILEGAVATFETFERAVVSCEVTIG